MPPVVPVVPLAAAFRNLQAGNWQSDLEDFHDFVPVVVDDLDGDPAGSRPVERTGFCAIERLPSFEVDVSFQRKTSAACKGHRRR